MCQTFLKPGASASFITSWGFQFIFNHISSFSFKIFFFFWAPASKACKEKAGESLGI